MYILEKRKSQIFLCASSNSEFAEDSVILGHKILFPRDMRNEFKDMRVKFGSTFYDVRLLFSKKWSESQSDINNVKALLIDIFPDLRAELSVVKTIDGVLDVVKRKCSIIDIRPLEVLAQKFEVKEAEAIIREHKEAAEEFCKSVSVNVFQDQTLQVIPTQHLLCETITFVLNWNPDETTLQDINDVLLELKVLHKYQIKVVGVGTGSVIVTCYCPAEYTSSLIVTVLKKIEILQERGLTDFIVGNCTIWNNVAHEVSEMTNKEIDQITKSTVIDYEDTEKELRQQLAEKNRKILELQQEKQQAHLLPAESNDELNKKLEVQFAIGRRKTLEIEDLKATVRQKEDKIIAIEKELVSLRELSENQLQEIEQLKLKLNALPVAACMTTHTVESDNEVIKSKGELKSCCAYNALCNLN
ncbi:PREDICTED: uncharacterized protein LOC109592229, partial [Amphimedon queenslandica]|uniref:Uncharacterized protein n=2 Tax=Amphimedon queenslandica TaxID=400682 RepID=A0AAN0K199_AMPQE